MMQSFQITLITVRLGGNTNRAAAHHAAGRGSNVLRKIQYSPARSRALCTTSKPNGPAMIVSQVFHSTFMIGGWASL